MRKTNVDQTFLVEFSSSLNLATLLNGFITDRNSRQFSPYTIRHYQVELGLFARYLEQVKVVNIEEITPTIIRNYLFELAERRNSGRHFAGYQVLHTMTYWWEHETE